MGTFGARTMAYESRDDMNGQQSKEFLVDREDAHDVINLAKTLHKIPTLLTTWTRCGKLKCRCRDGHLHGPYYALYWREGSRQRRRYITATNLAAVRTIIAQRRHHRAHERQADTDALALLRQLRALEREMAALAHNLEER
jgi:hypothetical protein